MRSPELSLVCWVGSQHHDLLELHRAYRETVLALGRSAEFLYLLDGPRPRAEASLRELAEDCFPVRVLRLAKGFGESAALQYGFEAAVGRLVVTVPDRFQAEPSVLAHLLAAVEGGADLAVARRDRRGDAWLNRVQYRVYHRLMRSLTGQAFGDVTSGLRALRTEAARRLDLYGDLHRFLPILAARMGFTVVEIDAPQHASDRQVRLTGPGVYARRLLDLLNVFFLTRFTRKPLRFFGLIGMALASVGVAVCAFLAVERLFARQPLADRPLLLLGVLLIVLGVQLASIGLVGEIILFLSMRRDVPEVVDLQGVSSQTSENPSRPR